MHFNDDLAIKFQPLKVIACIPALGRFPLLRLTIQRLFRKNKVFKVIVAGHEPEVRKICEEEGAMFIYHQNFPLGKKWNAAFRAAAVFNPDAVLFSGSSDWLSDDWLELHCPYLSHFDMAGSSGCYFGDIGRNTNLLVHWPGYTNYRKGESIGIGRLLASRVMNKIDWQPFNDDLDNSLDKSMTDKLAEVGAKITTVNTGKALSISTYKWTNKHKFIQHWTGMLPSERIAMPELFFEAHFPEFLTLSKNL